MRRRGFLKATPSSRGADRKIRSTLALVGVLLCAFSVQTVKAAATDGFGGSFALASDYLVRGISRTDHEPALQLDLHYSTSLGFFAGAFASNARIGLDESREAELSAYLGFAWNKSEDWHARALLNHYAYPWDDHVSRYDYDEFDAQLSYQGWAQLSVNYSPNYPRFLRYPVNKLKGVAEQSVELNLQRPVFGKLSITGGVGYANVGGSYPDNYVYFSLGAAYDIGAFSLAVSYVDTTAGAKALFYNEAAENRVTGTIIWRF